MRSRIATVLGAAAAALMLSISSAAADTIIDDDGDTFVRWKRNCGTTYSGTVQKTVAITAKGSEGECAGHAWIRVLGDTWGEWRHDSEEVRLTSPNGKFRAALHKGCETCTVYTTYAQ